MGYLIKLLELFGVYGTKEQRIVKKGQDALGLFYKAHSKLSEHSSFMSQETEKVSLQIKKLIDFKALLDLESEKNQKTLKKIEDFLV